MACAGLARWEILFVQRNKKLVAPLTHHPFVSKSQAPGGWNLLQQVAPLTHLAPVTHHRTVVGTCHWWVSGRRPNSLEYQICTAPEPFDTVVTGLAPAPPHPADFDPSPAPPRIVGKGGFPAPPRPVDFLPCLSLPCPAP